MDSTLDTAGNPRLEEIIRRRIEEKDGIPFSEFMELCLYHPEEGYYMAPGSRIGKSGDFFTSSSVHSLFGRLISRQLRQMWEILGGGLFTIAEQGAGEGHLALDILEGAAAEAPEFYRNLRYRIVEVSPEGRKRQAEVLGGHGNRVDWCELDDLEGLEGCLLSNELVDAFPVHLIENRGGELREVFVISRGEGFAEELRSPSTSEIPAYFERLGISPAEGNRAEVNLKAVRWMRQIGGVLRRGFVMTIDYGYSARDLFAPFRREGTLMCYYRHIAGENPYQRIGRQDITAHIDFTTLEKVGEKERLNPLYFGEQYRFLLGLGFLETLMEMQERETDENRARDLRLTLKNLIVPEGGMGEIFKVLIQGKAVGHPELLCGRPISEVVPPV